MRSSYSATPHGSVKASRRDMSSVSRANMRSVFQSSVLDKVPAYRKISFNKGISQARVE